jgi:hypothetical protein
MSKRNWKEKYTQNYENKSYIPFPCYTQKSKECQSREDLSRESQSRECPPRECQPRERERERECPPRECRSYLNVYKNTSTPAQTIPDSVPTVISFDTILFDNHSHFNTVASRFFPKIPGIYSITTTVGINANGTFSSIEGFIRKNGLENVADTLTEDGATNTIAPSSPISTLVKMNGVSDYLEVVVIIAGFNAVGTIFTVVNGQPNTYFTAFLVERLPGDHERGSR